MNNPQSSLPPESTGSGAGTSRPQKVGVYEQPERKGGLSPLLIGIIAILIMVVMAILAFQFLF